MEEFRGKIGKPGEPFTPVLFCSIAYYNRESSVGKSEMKYVFFLHCSVV
jgi:hypothetical protein